MNPAEKAELDRILAEVDYIEGDEASEQPGPSLELTGAVTIPTVDAVALTTWHPAIARGGKG